MRHLYKRRVSQGLVFFRRDSHLFFPPAVIQEITIPVNEAITSLENRRVKRIRPLIPPQILQEDLPLYVRLYARYEEAAYRFYRTLSGTETVLSGRHAAEEILHGNDDRIVVVVGQVLRHRIP